MILAIDPGNEQSAFVIMDEGFNIQFFGKVENGKMLKIIDDYRSNGYKRVVIEMVASYGMAVGREVFETCVWIGRFMERAIFMGCTAELLYRLEEKLTICQDSKAKDSNIRRALIDRFAKHDLRSGRGTKKNPDFFYGFSADMWAAFAVGYTYIMREEEGFNAIE